ncbi:ABC transporter permease [Candidatus Nitrosotenuis cloacae]|uniref:ABC transporter permease n=1 Tax=Candidatus Nitrosotenuis cloacae TaxID=1603555 RepID=UPI0022823EC5|nr:ABC transporter permease [Candidatus Nitrosotenuis cloacae]
MSISTSQIRQGFLSSRIGLAGVGILVCLVVLSALTAIFIPIETYQQWNNPTSWTLLPKSALPFWVNYFSEKKIPEHQIIESARTITQDYRSHHTLTQEFVTDYAFDYFPNDMIFQYTANYEDSALLQMDVMRPDGVTLRLATTSLPHSEERVAFSDRIFFTSDSVRKNLLLQSSVFSFPIDGMSASEVVFSDSKSHQVLKGRYVFSVKMSGFSDNTMESKLILGGKVFGFAGTDELRRDLAVGLLWGIPVALFIGTLVSVGSVVSGLVFGVYAGYKGGKTDESMMRLNDIVYALPALPFLIILSVTTSNSIFVMIGFLMIFGWVGVAKVSRSMALQIKTRQFVDAAKMMGQKDSRIIFRHIIPQILPYALASIAISVPAAITTEAGLSFLGLGDPSFPTWGQILHDAKSHGAAARGLWWWIVPPGVMIAATGLAFVFIGTALEAIANPKMKR